MDAGDLVPGFGHDRDGAQPARRGGRGPRLPARRFPAHGAAGRALERAAGRPRPQARHRARTGRRRRRGGAPAVRAPHLPAAAARSGTSISTRPTREGICDRCGGDLFQRDDDMPETVRHRLEVYAEQTAPLISFYAARGILVVSMRPGRWTTSPTGRSRRSAGTRTDAGPPSAPQGRSGCEANRMSRRDEVQIKIAPEILLMREAGLVVGAHAGQAARRPSRRA